ncbi:MAG: peptide deformylase [Candidatus Eisenbacteria bacterium]|nr:peptide deformylase [Candidatus Eisenbacteria bacterium]
MPVRPIRIYGDPVLRQKSRRVGEIDDTVRCLVEDLRETMKAYNGVGLAANQVGVAQRVLVVDVPIDEQQRASHALINPMISKREGSESGEEGCLSIPGIWEDVTRSQRVHVEALDENGRNVVIEAEGYLARALQHEVDHLDGVLFTDRLSALKRQFLRRSLEALARGELPEGSRPQPGGGGDG